MTKQETIQVLQSIEDRAIKFPNMTECDWVAIAAAKRHLQEEPVNEDLEEYSDLIADELPQGTTLTSNGEFDITSVRNLIKDACNFGAKWKEQQMMTKAIDGKVIANGMGKPILHLWDKGRYLIDKKVKVIVIKED